MKKRVLIIGIVVAVAALVGAFFYTRRGSAEPKFRKAKIDKGDVVATVTATGTLSAVTTGQGGQPGLGHHREALRRLQFDREERAASHRARSDAVPANRRPAARGSRESEGRASQRGDLAHALEEPRPTQQLLAQSDLDGAQTARDSAAAAVAQSQAALKQAETNLSYARITSPIDGVVVDRQYDVGQTVAASFQAPVIFTIAQDLTKMQVLTNIDEADVGRVKVGQEATFSVDAFSGPAVSAEPSRRSASRPRRSRTS